MNGGFSEFIYAYAEVYGLLDAPLYKVHKHLQKEIEECHFKNPDGVISPEEAITPPTDEDLFIEKFMDTYDAMRHFYLDEEIYWCMKRGMSFFEAAREYDIF